MTYRVGNRQPQNVYRDDRYIGVMFTAEDAALVVEAMNDGAGPCSVSLPDFFDTEFATSCELRHGHTGDHEAGPTRWREIRP